MQEDLSEIKKGMGNIPKASINGGDRSSINQAGDDISPMINDSL
jgi:hypothetical protein